MAAHHFRTRLQCQAALAGGSIVAPRRRPKPAQRAGLLPLIALCIVALLLI